MISRISVHVGLDDGIAVGIDVGWHRGPGSPPIAVGIGGRSDEPELDDR